MAFNQINRNNKQRPFGKNCVIVYGYDEEAIEKIKACTKEVGIKICIPVQPDRVGATLRQCIDESFEGIEAMEPIEERAVILNAVSDYELHHFMQKFKALELVKPIFATVTPTSIKWKLSDLLAELRAEKVEMDKRNS